jgi:hypothetical protein
VKPVYLELELLVYRDLKGFRERLAYRGFREHKVKLASGLQDRKVYKDFKAILDWLGLQDPLELVVQDSMVLQDQ